MATQDYKKQFEELIKQLDGLGASTRQIDAMRNSFKAAAGDGALMAEEIKRAQQSVVALQSESLNLNESFRDLANILAQNAQAVESTGQFISRVGRTLGGVRSISEDLLADFTGVQDLNRRDLESRIENLQKAQQQLKLYSQQAEAQKQNLNAQLAAGKVTQRMYDRQVAQLDDIIKYNADQDVGITGLIGKTKERLDLETQIENSMGVTGAMVEGTGALMERLGMRSGIFHRAMEQAAQEMRDMSRAAAEGTKNFTRLQIISQGLSTLFKGFSKAVFSLEGAGLAVAQAFLDINKTATETVQLTGQNALFTEGFNSRLATSQQYLETINELTKQTGMNAQNIFSNEVLQGAAELQNTLGLAANEAGGLAMIAQTTSGDIDGVTDAVIDQVSAFNKANRSAVSQGQVLRDVATAADGIKASFAGMPGQITKAAATARRLGMELSDLDSIASSLLDFESSIESELEAQLLTGRQMNLAKARELALNNDLAGVGKEIFKNSASLVQFGKMNRIQQEAQAKALGLTRDQLGKIAYQRAIEAGMTSEQAAAAAGVNKEEMERIAIQEKIQMLLGKLAQAFTPIIEALVPIVDMFASLIAPVAGFIGYLAKGLATLIKFEPVMMTLKGLVMAVFGMRLAGYIKNLFMAGKSMKQLVAIQKAYNAAEKTHGILLSTKKLDGRLKAARDMKNMTIGQTIALKANNAVRKVSIVLQKAYAATTNFLTASLTRLIGAERIKAIQTKLSNAYERIALFLGKSRIAQYIAEKAQLVASTVAKYANIGASAGQTAANTALATSQTAVATTGAAAGGGLAAAGAGLGAFGAAAAPAIPIILAIGAGLLMASPAIYAFGVAIKAAFEGVASIVSAVGGVLIGMLDVITLEKAAALVVMGAGMVSLAGGLAILTASIFSSIPAIGMLGAIAVMGTGLMNAGTGIKVMAEGVAKLSEALETLETSKLEEVKDLITTAAISAPAVAATGAITSLIQGIAGTGGEGGNTDAKLDELIAAVKSGANVRVYLDSDDITKRTVIESTTLS